MTSEIKEVFVLSSIQFSILLAGKGVSTIYMLSKKERQINLEEISLAMHQLYQNRLIDGVGEVFVIKDSLNVLLDGIKDAQKILLLQQGGKGHCSLCCYIGKEQIVAMQISTQDEDAVKLFAIKREELLEQAGELLDKQVDYVSILDEEEIYSGLLTNKRAIEIKEINRFRNIVFILEEIEYETGLVSCRIVKRQLHKQQVTEAYKKGHVESIAYSKEYMMDQVKEILEGLQQ